MRNKLLLSLTLLLPALILIGCTKSNFEKVDWQRIYHSPKQYEGEQVMLNADWYQVDWYINKKEPKHFVFNICTRYVHGPEVKCRISSSKAKIESFSQDLAKVLDSYSKDFTMIVKGRVQNGVVKVKETKLCGVTYFF